MSFITFQSDVYETRSIWEVTVFLSFAWSTYLRPTSKALGMRLFRTNPSPMIGDSLVFKRNRRDVNYRELLVVVIVIVIVTTGDT